jgi:hypothetical protein
MQLASSLRQAKEQSAAPHISEHLANERTSLAWLRTACAFVIDPGHDAWVEGDETCELLDVTGYEKYAKAA